ncbi:MAG: ATP-grasp domain-containing protein, partial [Planctomycetaceae bacterium]
VPQPVFDIVRCGDDVAGCAERIGYPCVVKPLGLAGSKGVIRVDDQQQLLAAVARLKRILATETELHATPSEANCAAPPGNRSAQASFLIEQFVAGGEVAVEGMLRDGQLEVLAIFDKPDPLDGPFFEETIYLTPSRLPATRQRQIAVQTQQAVQALKLSEGPVHAELRLSADGPVVIEVNARSIGGKCSQVLKFGTGWSLEELIICQALDPHADLPPRQSQPAGVMMIPTPAVGVLTEVRGLSVAEDVNGIESINIIARPGQLLIPLPEGSIYLGFIFARGETVEQVEHALRVAHSRLEFVIEPTGAGTAAAASLPAEDEIQDSA